MNFTAEDAEPYVMAAVLGKGFSKRLPNTYQRRDAFESAIRTIFETDIQEYGFSLRDDQIYMIPKLFDDLVSSGVIIEDSDKLAGSFFVFSSDRYTSFRHSWLNGSDVHARAQRIGGNFIGDALSAFYAPNNSPNVVIPASDRIVALDHNSADLVEIQDGLNDLRNKLSSNNDIGNLSEEGQLVAVKEVEQLIDDLSAPFIRAESFKDKAINTLQWIGKEAASSVVGAAALALLALVAAYFGLIF